MELNHRKHIEGEIIHPVLQKLYKSLSFNRITHLNRIEIVLKKWSVEFEGTFSQSSISSAEILLSPKYSNIQITLSIQVDGIPIAIKQFEFSQSLRQGSLFEALEGTSFGIYEIVEPVLAHGFCSGCNRPYQRNSNKELICGCIEKIEADAKA